MSKILRDAEDYAPDTEASAPSGGTGTRRGTPSSAAGGWRTGGSTLLAALGHALNFWTWRSLVGDQGLSDEEAVEVMVGMVRSSARG